jgi:hypothetical protein
MLKSQRCLFVSDATTVISHSDQAAPTAPNLDAYVCRSGIDGILDQLFGYRSRSLHNFARGDLARHSRWQHLDGHISNSRIVRAEWFA